MRCLKENTNSVSRTRSRRSEVSECSHAFEFVTPPLATFYRKSCVVLRLSLRRLGPAKSVHPVISSAFMFFFPLKIVGFISCLRRCSCRAELWRTAWRRGVCCFSGWTENKTDAVLHRLPMLGGHGEKIEKREKNLLEQFKGEPSSSFLCHE